MTTYIVLLLANFVLQPIIPLSSVKPAVTQAAPTSAVTLPTQKTQTQTQKQTPAMVIKSIPTSQVKAIKPTTDKRTEDKDSKLSPPSYTTVDPQALLSQAPALKKEVLTTALNIFRCAIKDGANDRGYLTLIDFTKPSNEKRLWVINLRDNKILYHTYVAHGVHTGTLYATDFSNEPKSRKSSIGIFETLHTYDGEHGESLRLKGHDKGFNDKMLDRDIVMHNAWYVSEDFIKKYGRIGRSWGCPAVSKDVSKEIINKIRNSSQIIAYYPDKEWLSKTKYLKCD